MIKHFFTGGGSLFWEDLFFYRDWRIQRNNVNKKCRLLDNWNISRFEGTFEECRKAFIKYIEVYEIARQKGKMIVMLPGFGKTTAVFKKMKKQAEAQGYAVATINYPTTHKGLKAHVRQLDFWLNHLEDVEEVSFITQGVSSIMLRLLFNSEEEWKKRLKVGRIVDIAPWNHGSPLLVRLSENRIMNFILGPLAEELKPERIEKIPPYPSECETGLILSDSKRERILEKLFKIIRAPSNPEEERRICGAKEVLCRYSLRFNSLNSSKIIKAALSFIRSGSFEA